MQLVRVRGAGLYAGDRPFYFAGTNCYYLLTRSADESQRPMVTEVLDDAKRLNLTVLRCWAFCDGAEWNALQPEPGKFSDKVFAGLDWLIVEAGRRGIRLLLTLTNYWANYGGMPAYVRWKYGIKDKEQHDYTKYPTSLFYTDPEMRDNFRRAVSALVGRVNSLSGVPYAQDPIILGWDLANEPRCPEGPPGGAGPGDRVLQEWVASTADFVRGLDPNHLITLGTEGFYGPSTPNMLSFNPYEAASRLGADWAAVCRSVDLVAIHIYPDSWMLDSSSREDIRRWIRNWIRSHAALCTGVPFLKPLVVSEFGKREPGRYTGPDGCTMNMGREEAFKEVLGSCRELAEGGGPLAGVCGWMTAARQYPDYDGFTLQLGPPEAPDRAAAPPAGPHASSQLDEPAVQLLQEYGKAMAQLSPPQPAAA